jgi:hypothetical protein
MTVLNREGLEAAACSCYAIVRNQFESMPGGEATRPGRRRLSSGLHVTDNGPPTSPEHRFTSATLRRGLATAYLELRDVALRIVQLAETLVTSSFGFPNAKGQRKAHSRDSDRLLSGLPVECRVQ